MQVAFVQESFCTDQTRCLEITAVVGGEKDGPLHEGRSIASRSMLLVLPRSSHLAFVDAKMFEL